MSPKTPKLPIGEVSEKVRSATEKEGHNFLKLEKTIETFFQHLASLNYRVQRLESSSEQKDLSDNGTYAQIDG